MENRYTRAVRMGDWIVKLPQTQRKPVNHSTSRLDLVRLNLTTASNPIRLQTKATGASSPPTSLPVQPGEREAARAVSGDGCLPSSSSPPPPPNPSPGFHRGRRGQDLGPPHPDLARHLPLQVSLLRASAPHHTTPRGTLTPPRSPEFLPSPAPIRPARQQ